MKDNECIFCKIANGEIPSRTLYEDEDFRVIMDMAPVSKGHSLILPKQHYRSLYELDDRIAERALPLAGKMARIMTEKLKCDGFNIMQNNNEAAGQTVFHFHMHLIPRYSGDGDAVTMNPKKADDRELDDIMEQIIK